MKGRQALYLALVVVLLIALVLVLSWPVDDPSDRGAAAPREHEGLVGASHEVTLSPAPTAPTLDALHRASALDDAHLQVYVHDDQGRPIPHARVYRRGEPASGAESVPEVLAVTDEDGWSSVPRIADTVVLGAWVEGRLASEREVRPDDPVVELVLGAGGVLRGRLFWMDGAPLGERGLVVSWPTGYAPAQLTDDASTLPRWHLARTGDDGGFEITGLDPGTPYTLSAVGPWAIAAEPMYGVAPDGTPRLLSVSPLHGLDVLVAATDGRGLAADPHLIASGIDVDEGVSRQIGPDRVELELLGLEPAPDPPGTRRSMFLYAASTRLELIGPLSFSLEVPGYERATAELLVPRVTSATLDRLRLEVAPLTDVVGTLDVTLEGVMDPGRSVRARRSIGVLRLAPVAPLPDTRSIWLRGVDMGQEHIRIEGLPAGAWDVSWLPSLRFPGLTTLAPPVRIEIGDEPARASLDIGPTGTIAIEIVDSPERDYRGTAAFTLRPAGSADIATFSFHEGPYVITTVPPGTYELRVTCPHPGGPQGALTPEFVVADGRVTEIVLPRP